MATRKFVNCAKNVNKSNRCTKRLLNEHYAVLLRHKSTETSTFGGIGTKLNDDVIRSTQDELDLSFNNAKDTFKSKSTRELFRAWVVLNMCRNQWLVDNNKEASKHGIYFIN